MKNIKQKTKPILRNNIYFFENDHVVQTSMLDSRLICGSETTYHQVRKQFKLNI